MNSEIPFSDSDDLADDIFAIHTYEPEAPQKKSFLPWHMPRKHYVRKYQWTQLIWGLVEENKPQDGRLKYLGLPGIDLLDLRYLQSEICVPKELQLRFLGFNREANPNSKAQTELNTSIDEVRKLGVDPISDVVGDDFRAIANDSSIAWRKAKDLGPYDVVNLDLCDGFGQDDPGSLDLNNYTAVAQLLSLQARRTDPWLLLLTTRVGKDHVNADVLQTLLDQYASNLACERFRDASAKSFNIHDAEALKTAVEDVAVLAPVFLVSLCKWLVGLGVNQNPPTRVKVLSVVGYRIVKDCAHEDLISLALKFEPMFSAVKDAAGLSSKGASPPHECDLCVRAVKHIVERQDADELLGKDEELKEQLIGETLILLESARYDVSVYREWLAAV